LLPDYYPVDVQEYEEPINILLQISTFPTPYIVRINLLVVLRIGINIARDGLLFSVCSLLPHLTCLEGILPITLLSVGDGRLQQPVSIATTYVKRRGKNLLQEEHCQLQFLMYRGVIVQGYV